MTNNNTSGAQKLLDCFEYYYKHLEVAHPEWSATDLRETATSLGCTIYIQSSKPAAKSWGGKSGGGYKKSYGGANGEAAGPGVMSDKQAKALWVKLTKVNENGWDQAAASAFCQANFGKPYSESMTRQEASKLFDAIGNGAPTSNTVAQPAFTDDDIPF